VPSAVTATAASCTQINLTWNASTDTGGSGLRGYRVYRNGTFLKEVAAPATSTTDTALIESTSYTYTVSAVDNATPPNESAQSGSVSRSTTGCPPSVPAGVTATATSCTSITVSWNASTDTGGSGLAGYRLYRNGAFVRDVLVPATSTTDTVTPASNYSYTLSAFDNAQPRNESAQSTPPAPGSTTSCPSGGGGAHIRSQHFGGTESDAGYAVATGPDNSVAVTGEFIGSMTIGGTTFTSSGQSDIFLAKFAADGTYQWWKRFGGTGNDRGLAVAIDSAGDVLLGAMFEATAGFGGGGPFTAQSRDFVIAKYDGATGTHLWSKRFGAEQDDYIYSIATDGNKDVIIGGTFVNTVDFGGGPLTSSFGSADAFLVKLSSGGTHVWSRRWGGGATEVIKGVAVDPIGNVAVTGSYMGAISFGGTALPSSGGFDNIVVAKYSPMGDHIWSKGFGSDFSDFGNAVAVDFAGNVIVTGTFRLTIDFGGGPMTSAGNTTDDIFLVKFGPDGTHLWSRRSGGPSSDSGADATVDTDGLITVTGYFQATADFGGGPVTSAGGYDIFVAQYSPSGAHNWSKRFGIATGDGDWGISVAADRQNRVALTGGFFGPVDFGGGALDTNGKRDIMLVTFGQ
jgi:hypothetical protein